MLILTLLLFCLALILCIIFNLDILVALIFGFFLFFSYGILKKFKIKEMLKFALNGALTVKNILLTFILIGMLTALWRAAGTIPSIITYASKLINPKIFLLISFLLNCLVSFLTGTSFGTSATMGVITMTMGLALNINPAYLGGSILAGAFFGDRCSPVSTSALLVSEVTKTDIYENIKKMFKTALVPFIITCIIYTLLGFINTSDAIIMDISSIFKEGFNIHILALIPALLILVLALFKVKVKMAMLLSIISAIFVCIFLQKIDIIEILKISIFGYKIDNEVVGSMLNGGGILSMKRVMLIILISASYSGVFKGTHMLDSLTDDIKSLGEILPKFLTFTLVSIAVCIISCNQSLATILTNQLCEKLETDNKKRAIFLEDSAIVIAPLIPWSIAGNVPLTTIGAPTISIIYSFFLFLLPIWHILIDIFENRKKAA